MILDLLREDGFELRWAADTNDGEYKGPCPFCGGKDRFCVWPKQGNGGRYWCRQCDKRGDAIQYLRDARQMTFQQACLRVGSEERLCKLKGTCRSGSKWKPKQARPAGPIWRKQALKWVEDAEEYLSRRASACSKRVRQWLQDRGLAWKTIKDMRLGLFPRDEWCPRRRWGLPDKIEGGKRKDLWLPAGLVIPSFRGGEINRLRIRRGKARGTPRYYMVPGSDTSPMYWETDRARAVCLVVESDLDGILLWQEVGALAGIVCLGSAQTKPDKDAHRVLSRADLILVALDADEAGAVQTCRWWLKRYQQAKWWPIPTKYGKDPSEAFKAGLDLRTWIRAGIAEDIVQVERQKEEGMTIEKRKETAPYDERNCEGSDVSIEELLSE